MSNILRVYVDDVRVVHEIYEWIASSSKCRFQYAAQNAWWVKFEAEHYDSLRTESFDVGKHGVHRSWNPSMFLLESRRQLKFLLFCEMIDSENGLSMHCLNNQYQYWCQLTHNTGIESVILFLYWYLVEWNWTQSMGSRRAYGIKSTSRWCQTGLFPAVAEWSSLCEIETNIDVMV